MSTYFIILLLSFVVPFAFSFDRKVAFYKKWKYLFPAMLIVAAVFIAWDVVFTKNQYWGFNHLHISEIKLFNLPLEECLFFIIIPYNMVFVYEVLKGYFTTTFLENKTRKLSIFLAVLLFIPGLIFIQNPYTSITFISAALLLILIEFVLDRNYLHWFFVSYLIVLIPFLIVNGLLTGSIVEEEVVWYNSDAIIGLRVFTIPIEDFVYNLLLFLSNITLYETLKKTY